MVSVAAHAGAEHVAVDLGAARLCVLVAFNDKNALALAQSDVAAAVKGRAGVAVERVERVEAAESER